MKVEEYNDEALNENAADDVIIDMASDYDEAQFPRKRFVDKLKAFFNLHDDSASHEVIRARIRSGGKVTGTNAVILICAIAIASTGLITSSIPVVIGAMLISPLMGTIMAVAFGVASNDKKFTFSSLRGFAFQVCLSLLISTLYFLILPTKEPTPELLARTAPSWHDMVIACFGGIAGIVATTREDKVSNVLPGVAIATALMPPICTMGFSLANGEWRLLAGAAYLFLINFYLIFFTSVVVLTILSVPRVRKLTEAQWDNLHLKMIRNAILSSIPLFILIILISLDIQPY